MATEFNPLTTTINDGREMHVRLCRPEEAAIIAAEHVLPRTLSVPEALYRQYYEFKAYLYIQTPGCGVLTGWVDGTLAGFLFFCQDITVLRASVRRPRMLGRLVRMVLGNSLRHLPVFCAQIAAWGLQHLRQPQDCRTHTKTSGRQQDFHTWLGTAHTVAAFRRQGIASVLFTQVHSILRSLGCTEVAGYVADDNDPSSRMLLKLGYLPLGDVSRLDERCFIVVKSLVGPADNTEVLA